MEAGGLKAANMKGKHLRRLSASFSLSAKHLPVDLAAGESTTAHRWRCF